MVSGAINYTVTTGSITQLMTVPRTTNDPANPINNKQRNEKRNTRAPAGDTGELSHALMLIGMQHFLSLAQHMLTEESGCSKPPSLWHNEAGGIGISPVLTRHPITCPIAQRN